MWVASHCPVFSLSGAKDKTEISHKEKFEAEQALKSRAWSSQVALWVTFVPFTNTHFLWRQLAARGVRFDSLPGDCWCSRIFVRMHLYQRGYEGAPAALLSLEEANKRMKSVALLRINQTQFSVFKEQTGKGLLDSTRATQKKHQERLKNLKWQNKPLFSKTTQKVDRGRWVSVSHSRAPKSCLCGPTQEEIHEISGFTGW